MKISSALVETGSCFEQKFQPVIQTSGWRVAVLRQCANVMPGDIQRVERHNETDEVFILTLGKADLIIIEEKGNTFIPHVIPMKQNVAYNIKKSVWHHVNLSEDAHIFLFEKADTSTENSDYMTLSPEVQEAIMRMIKDLRSKNKV
ncbi:MAG: hypothetical protein JW973_07915 [Bacteroidales bacterium]|nr:hypothetical protein [Bacteroidales bacterium]